MILRPAVLVFALILASVLPAAVAQDEGAQVPAAGSVRVGPDDTGNWKVRYTFSEPQNVLAFSHSKGGYRDATWTIEGDGARFGRVNGVDVIVFDEPSIGIAFSIIPLTGQLPDDYTPFVTFSDGGIAVYDGQFELVPFSSLAGVEKLEGSIADASSSALALDFTLETESANGADGPGLRRIEGSGRYVYTGPGTLADRNGFSILADGGLPGWIASDFASDMEGFLASLERLWGYELAEPFSLMVAYKGAAAQGLTLHGNALDNQLVLELGGRGFSQANSEALAYLHWYTIREIVQLFQTGRGVSLAGPEAAWIHDGAANSIAYQLIAADMQSADQFLSSVYGNAFEDCVKTLEGGTLESARARGAVTGPYACGDFIALATDSILKRRDLFGFWTALNDWAARSPGKVIDKKVYFTTLQLLGATPAQRERIRAIVEDELPQPRKALTELLQTSGLEPKFASGRLVSLNWPDYSAE